jgi:hypothetical protein
MPKRKWSLRERAAARALFYRYGDCAFHDAEGLPHSSKTSISDVVDRSQRHITFDTVSLRTLLACYPAKCGNWSPGVEGCAWEAACVKSQCFEDNMQKHYYTCQRCNGLRREFTRWQTRVAVLARLCYDPLEQIQLPEIILKKILSFV